MIIPSVSLDLLGPLHKTMYEHMAGQSWVLRGSPSVEKLREVLEEDWKTSIDLVAATDGLTIDVAETCLDVAQSTSSRVPAEIFRRARESLRPIFTHDGDVYRVASGQQMGQYLSFPLLCFQSYAAACWATRGVEAKILVNGDDCLIGCSSEHVISQYPSHLEINFDKTAVSRTVAEINSTQFVKQGRRWREIVAARRLGGVNRKLSGLVHLAQSCLKGGNKWITAFVRSRIGRRQRVSPIDLGLPGSHKSVFWRNFGMPYRRVIPFQPADKDERLEMTEEKNQPHQVEDFRNLLFDEGRFKPEPLRDFYVKDLPYRKVKVKYLPGDSYLRYLSVGEKEKKKRETYFRVKSDPVSQAEVEPHVPAFWERVVSRLASQDADRATEKYGEVMRRGLRGRST
jgi:hypothetical protein